MVVCPECGYQDHLGAIFCTECGVSLLELGGKLAISDEVDLVQIPELTGKGFETIEGKRYVVFVIPSSGRNIELPFGKGISIGRMQPDATNVPDLNLINDGGVEAGVSRRHAEMRLDEKGQHLVVIDKNSTNGTLLNHFLLPPDLPYPVKHGDEIQFGNLLVHVFFK